MVLLLKSILFFSNNIEHDVAFVEICYRIIHQDYSNTGKITKKNYEINNGCTQQFQSYKGFLSLMEGPLKPDQVFFDSLHGKSVSYGVGGHLKSALVCTLHFWSAWVLWSILLVEDGKKKMKYRRFFLVNLTWLVQTRKADLN